MQYGEAQAALTEFGIDTICERIHEGDFLRDIAIRIGVSIGSLSAWLAADPERSARAREARRATAQLWEEKAAQVIEDAEDAFELAKARELAHQYRWKASKMNPREYGDKLELAGDKESPLTVVIQKLTGDA
jgi:transposase